MDTKLTGKDLRAVGEDRFTRKHLRKACVWIIMCPAMGIAGFAVDIIPPFIAHLSLVLLIGGLGWWYWHMTKWGKAFLKAYREGQCAGAEVEEVV